MVKKKESLYEPRKLTYEEHKRIDEFLRYFQDEGQVVFDLIRRSFGDYEKPPQMMAKAINYISTLTSYLETKSYIDKPYDLLKDFEKSEEWSELYSGICLWQTEGWMKMK